MEDLRTNTGDCDDNLSAKSQELDILRKAYELILENSALFFNELNKAFSEEREKGEFNPMI